MDKNVEKQLIVRTFEPDMAVLKQVAKQMNGMQDVALNLFGQAGEVLIVITARAHAPAAATELTERIAERFEMALGDAAYGRGKGSVAYFAAGELMQAEALVAASDPKTGGLLGEEFSHTKRGANVFDFGDSSYQDSRVAAKIKTMAAKNCDATYPPQVAAARAAAAAKCSKAEFGVSVTGLGKAGRDVYMAVAYGGQVYVRRFAQTPDAGKRCALAALDTIRRLLQGADTPAMRVFKANSDFDWDAPEAPRKKGRPAAGGAGNKNSGMLAPIIVLVVLLIALGGRVVLLHPLHPRARAQRACGRLQHFAVHCGGQRQPARQHLAVGGQHVSGVCPGRAVHVLGRGRRLPSLRLRPGGCGK